MTWYTKDHKLKPELKNVTGQNPMHKTQMAKQQAKF